MKPDEQGRSAPTRPPHPHPAPRADGAGGRACEDRRGRILAAAARLAADHGEESVTVARVVQLADVSRDSFYEHFEDRGDCLSAARNEFAVLMARRTRSACESGDGWVERMRAGLLALLEGLDENRGLARICVAHAVSFGLPVRGPGSWLLKELVPALEEGRESAPADRQPPAGAAMSAIGGTLGMIHVRLFGSDEPLVDLVNPLMGMVVLPYLGEAAALRELTRPRGEDQGPTPGAWQAGDGGRSTAGTHERPRT